MGLLITPSGLRLPLYRSYYTKEYLKQRNQRRAKKKQPALPYHSKRHKQPFLARGLGFGGCFFHP